jgi:hypothetical protein
MMSLQLPGDKKKKAVESLSTFAAGISWPSFCHRTAVLSAAPLFLFDISARYWC